MPSILTCVVIASRHHQGHVVSKYVELSPCLQPSHNRRKAFDASDGIQSGYQGRLALFQLLQSPLLYRCDLFSYINLSKKEPS